MIERVLSGTDGTTDLGNGGDGVQLEGDDNTVSKSVISGNARDGINVAPSSGSSTGSGTTITGSVIGMKPDGTAPMANDAERDQRLGWQRAAGRRRDHDRWGRTRSAASASLLPRRATCNLVAGNGSDQIKVAVSAAPAPTSPTTC